MSKKKTLTGTLLAAGLIVGVVSAQEVVIQPVSTTLEATGSAAYLQSDPHWIDGSGFTNGLESIIETGDPVPASTNWPEHIAGYNNSRVERIRDAAEFETLTFDLGGVFELTGMVLWNSTELGRTDRGFENTALSYSTDGGTTFTPGETLTWSNRTDAAAPNTNETLTYAPEVQALITSVPGVTHVRMVVDNFSFAGSDVIIMASELRFTGLPSPEVYYVASSRTDWTDPAAWSDNNPAGAGKQYLGTNSVVLETPATTATFPGTSLTLSAPQRMELMATGSDVITIDALELSGAEVAAGVVDAGEAKLDGTLNVASASMISGSTTDSRDVRILSLVSGGTSIDLSAPSHTIYIDNTNNTFGGTWVIAGGTAEFAGGGAVGLAGINVQSNGSLRILGDWDGLVSGDSLTVADSATAAVDLGTYAWKVNNLTIGTNIVQTGFTYAAAELNGIGAAVFSGSGTIQVGAPYVPPQPPQLLHHWKFDEGAGFVAADSAGTNDGVISGATWASDGVRSNYLSFNGTDSSVNPSVTNATPTADNGETWACWVLDPATAANNNDIIIGNRGGSTDDFGKLTVRDSGRMPYRQDGVLVSYSFNTGKTNLTEDTWHHLAFVRDGSNAVFYVDGSPVNDDNPFVLPLANASALPFFVGGEPGLVGTATEFFQGGIDDVVIYNYALAPEQVVDVMNGIYVFGPTESPVLSIAPSGGSVIAFWAETGFKLQTRPSLTGGSWSDYPGGSTSPVNVPATNDVEFLRLIQQ